ncbi:MAG: aminotransferase class IV, partial [Kiritimatiellae bacterium]|nr:aminotransferase class IV [Kiritimatiellia bacterium]
MKLDFGMADFAAREGRKGYWEGYYAMYSGEWDAVTTDPRLMVVPLDDHMVHRGDGLFETCRCDGGGVYRMEAHWERMKRGAEAIGLALPVDWAGLVEVCAAV